MYSIPDKLDAFIELIRNQKNSSRVASTEEQSNPAIEVEVFKVIFEGMLFSISMYFLARDTYGYTDLRPHRSINSYQLWLRSSLSEYHRDKKGIRDKLKKIIELVDEEISNPKVFINSPTDEMFERTIAMLIENIRDFLKPTRGCFNWDKIQLSKKRSIIFEQWYHPYDSSVEASEIPYVSPI